MTGPPLQRPRAGALPLLALSISALASCGGGGSDPVAPPGQPPAKFVADWSDVDYTPATVARNPYQGVSVFLPLGTQPAGGWPLLLFSPFGGHASTTSVDEVLPSQRLLYGALSSGVAVAIAGITGSDDPSVLGQGTFDPPGAPWSGIPGQDHYGDDAYASCYKDAIWVVQFLRANSATYGLDPDRFFCMGRSAAATAWAWPALGPDRADPSATDFRAASSRVQGAIFNAGQFWFPAFFFDDPKFGILFPDEVDPVNAVAATMNDTFADYPKQASALYYGFQDAAVQGLNAQTPLFLHAKSGTQFQDFSLTADPIPVPALTAQIPDPHDPWFEYMLYQRLLDLDPAFHGANSQLVVGSQAALGTIETGIVDDDDELADMQLAWLLQHLSGAAVASSAAGVEVLEWYLLDEAGTLGEHGLLLRPR